MEIARRNELRNRKFDATGGLDVDSLDACSGFELFDPAATGMETPGTPLNDQQASAAAHGMPNRARRLLETVMKSELVLGNAGA